MGLNFEQDIPSTQTVVRVRELIDPNAFKECFTEWTKQVYEKLDGEIISIDDETVRGSRDQRPIHMISTWVEEQELVLGQMSVKASPHNSAVRKNVPIASCRIVRGCLKTNSKTQACVHETQKKNLRL